MWQLDQLQQSNHRKGIEKMVKWRNSPYAEESCATIEMHE